MADESLFGKIDEWVHQIKRVIISSNGQNPVVEWSIEKTNGRIVTPIRTFGSKEELDMVLAIEGKKIGKLADSAPRYFPRTIQMDWFDIEEIE